MSLKRCPECGASYIAVVVRCADCDVALVAEADGDAAPVAAPAATSRHEIHHHADDDDVEFDLSEWTNDERGLLDGRLTDAEIVHRWEGGGADAYQGHYATTTQEQWQIHATLVVREEDADRVDEILDEVEYPDALEAVDDDGATDEASYAVMSDLYVAADKLKNNPADPIAGDDLVNAAAVAATTAIPFGVEIRVWEQVQHLAAEVSGLLEDDAEPRTVAERSATLRDILSRFV